MSPEQARQDKHRTRHRKKIALWLVITCLAAVFAFTGSALYVIQSNWFKEQIRLKLITSVEGATGGHVELKSFHYDWRRLTAQANGFVLRGDEPAGGPPLVGADSIRIQLKILSALRQDVDISSLVVNRPTVFLLVREDGTTNIPEPKIKRAPGERPMMEQLLDRRSSILRSIKALSKSI